jgi:hypothetical protein
MPGRKSHPDTGRCPENQLNPNTANTMTVENAIRVLAGCMILTSLALAHYVSPNWLFLTGFVGLNLIQSAFTGFCPAEIVLKKIGVGGGCWSSPKDQA